MEGETPVSLNLRSCQQRHGTPGSFHINSVPARFDWPAGLLEIRESVRDVESLVGQGTSCTAVK